MCLWVCFCQNWRLLFHNGQWNLANQTLRGTIQLCRIWQGIAILSDKYYKDVFLQFGQFNNALMFFVIERIIYYLSEKTTFTHKWKAILVQMVFTSCLWEGLCLIYVICVCLCIVVSSRYCVVFFFSSCVPYVVGVSWLSILVFSNVYLVIKNIIRSIIIIIIIFLLYRLLQVDKK